MALEPTEQTALRLSQCYTEIDGIRSGHSAPPQDALQDEQLPAAIIMIRNLAAPPFIDPATTQQSRVFVSRILIAPVLEGQEIRGIGAEKYQEAVPFFDRIYVYFANHRDLSTAGGIITDLDALPGLGFIVTQEHTITDGGIVMRAGPGGGQYWAIDVEHTIPIRLSYCFSGD